MSKMMMTAAALAALATNAHADVLLSLPPAGTTEATEPVFYVTAQYVAPTDHACGNVYGPCPDAPSGNGIIEVATKSGVVADVTNDLNPGDAPVTVAFIWTLPEAATVISEVQGGDGDEQVNATATLVPSDGKAQSQQQKQQDRNLSHMFRAWSIGLGLYGGRSSACLASPQCLAGVATAIAAFETGDMLFSMLADDPPVPDYTVIATPAPVVKPDGLSPAATALVYDLDQANAIEAAMLTDADRYAGAFDAQAWYSAQQQFAEVQALQSRLAPLLDAIPQDLAAVEAGAASAVPEPSPWLVLTVGMAALAIVRFRRVCA